MKLLEFLEKHGDILFRGYWCGGADDSPKVREGRSAPKPLEHALKKFPWLLGALHPHIVLVDYDAKEAFDCRVKIAQALGQHCIAIRSSRGGHMYFYDTAHTVRTANTHNRTLLSFCPVDYKLGYKMLKTTGEIKPADSYACLSKEDKSLRELVYCNIREDNTLDEIPFYDLRVKASEKYDFLDMAAGDGRQEGLFTYMNPVKAAGYSYEQFKEAAELIEHYIFAVPLGEEFENAVRREAWDSVKMDSSVYFNEKGQFSFNRFGDHLIEKHHVKKINGQLYIYENGVYVPGHRAIEKAMLGEIPSLARARRNEVLDYLEVVCNTVLSLNADWIAFENGVYNIFDNTFSEFSPEHIITNKIRWNYNPGAYSKAADEMLNRVSCDDPQIRLLLEEMIGYCFYRRNELRKAFILTGDGSNGKSTFLAVIQSLLGEENIASLDLKELGDRFKTAEMVGKLANIGDDISDEFISNSAIFKKLVTGERVSVEQKGRDPFEFNNYSKLVFSANDIPRIKDKSGAVLDRLVIVPFNAKFTVEKTGFKSNIRRDLVGHADVMEYLINLGISGLKRILEKQQFTVSTKVQDELDDYRQRNNPILGFIRECEDEDFKIENEPTSKVYKRYQEYCLANGLQYESKTMFSKELNTWGNLKVGYGHLPGGKTIRIYCKK